MTQPAKAAAILERLSIPIPRTTVTHHLRLERRLRQPALARLRAQRRLHLAPAGGAGRAAHAAGRRQRGRCRDRRGGGDDASSSRAATAWAPTPSASCGTASSCTA
ncbi:MAG: hypothetical protein MZW92_49085 [Comamonadaceae bacterium]|nr:hypothetical protein [Comamonadaceae bacterium]